MHIFFQQLIFTKSTPFFSGVNFVLAEHMHIRFKGWSDQYGPVFSLKIGRSTIVVLNDPRAVHELLNKQGAVFSDRPVDEQYERTTRNEAFIVMHTGHIWRASRKAALQVLSSKTLDADFTEVLEVE
jgi:hypothetical protein